MKSKIEVIKKARESILNFSLNDGKDENLLEEIVNLKIAIEGFFSIFRFPQGSKKFFRRENGADKTWRNLK